jgi:hypothetical protein
MGGKTMKTYKLKYSVTVSVDANNKSEAIRKGYMQVAELVDEYLDLTQVLKAEEINH